MQHFSANDARSQYECLTSCNSEPSGQEARLNGILPRSRFLRKQEAAFSFVMYLFDYGDEWRFKVRVHAINPDAPAGDYPQTVESVGEAPEQYPRWDWE
jgi:hypothetical protein